MPVLDSLIRDARDLAARPAHPARTTTPDAAAEVERILKICNACRYCEGYCAVFPAMTRRLEFNPATVHYLANLCHNCGACLHACQYAEPHEFTVNVPRSMARVRLDTYAHYAWPAPLGKLYHHNGLMLALVLAGGLALFMALLLQQNGGLHHPPLAGNFYALFPHNMLVMLFGSVFTFMVLALALGVRRFWHDVQQGTAPASPAPSTTFPLADASLEAGQHVLTLKYLDGGHGQGCNNESDRFSLLRRRFHHFTFYGFLLCFAATCVATLYHYLLGLHAPYAFTSLPVLLGTAGGIGLLIGPAGLLWLNYTRHPEQGDPAQKPMDIGFIVLLLLSSLSGLALLALRQTSLMGLCLALHLGVIMAFFLTLPYGKFAHGIYRTAALLKWSIEKRQPNTLQLGSE